MPHEHLTPDVLLGIKLSAICGRNQYTTDPGPVIDELIAAAGDRADILAQEAGIWSGFHEQDEYRRMLAIALRDFPGMAKWAIVGRERRGAPRHSTSGFVREP